MSGPLPLRPQGVAAERMHRCRGARPTTVLAPPWPKRVVTAHASGRGAALPQEHQRPQRILLVGVIFKGK